MGSYHDPPKSLRSGRTDEDEDAKYSRARRSQPCLTTATVALKSLSLHTSQQPVHQNYQQSGWGEPLTPQSSRPYSSCPTNTSSDDLSLRQTGVITSPGTSKPAICHGQPHTFPTPQITFKSGDSGAPSFLPQHNRHNVRPFSGLVAGPSTEQIQRDARILAARQPVQSNSRPVFPYQRFTDQPDETGRKAARPRAVYVPRSDHAGGINSYVSRPFAGEASKQPLTDRIIARDSCPSGQYSQGLRQMTPSRFPYPSIYPVNAQESDASFERSAPSFPPTHYMTPNRVQIAALVAGRKRKRGWPTLPPPAHIYVRTNDPEFNVFGGILLYPELCFALAANLPVEDLLSLYAISKDFHTIIDTRFTTVILSQSLRKCPQSSRVFPFRCYKYLCQPDPAPRIPHPHPGKEAAGEIRKVPGFRWLKMIMFRDKVCHEIMTMMAEDGVPLPGRCELALKKMWFMMDIPDNARRIAYMHTKKLVKDLDIYFMMCFIVRLDLRFNDPVAPNRHHSLKKLALSQRGLVPLWRMLGRSILRSQYDAMRMWIITKYRAPDGEAGLPIFGINGADAGKMKMEYWGERETHDTGKRCTLLLRPEQIIQREILRRKIMFAKHFLRCFLWGYNDIRTMEPYPARVWEKRIKHLQDEYADDDECGSMGVPGPGMGDELLDLGIRKPISMLVGQGDP